MKTLTRSALLCLIVAFAIGMGLAAGRVLADDGKGRKGRDHDDAYRALQGGKILGLPEVLAIVRRRTSGEVLETEFDYEDGVPVYEFKYVDKTGRVRELEIDARTGAVIKDELDD